MKLIRYGTRCQLPRGFIKGRWKSFFDESALYTDSVMKLSGLVWNCANTATLMPFRVSAVVRRVKDQDRSVGADHINRAA